MVWESSAYRLIQTTTHGKKAITDNNLSWTHLSDLRGWESYAAKEYNVTAIPYTIVVDRNAKIIATGLRGEKLEKFIENYFNTPH